MGPEDDAEEESEATTLRRPQLLLPACVRTQSEPPLSSEPLPNGQPEQPQLGPFQLVSELASGGMATVYLALYRSVEGFEKVCAVKQVHPHLARHRDFADMFIDEAQLAARISHPFVCSVFFFGRSRRHYYVAMEFLRGESLAALFQRIGRQPFLAEDPRYPYMIARLIAGLAEGLHAAHTLRDERGVLLDVVHRDVSPQNLFVLYDGTVRVTDFGIAQARQRLHQTQGQRLKGKLAYVAPEQLTGARADPRADLWALGVVFWELLTGKRLFSGKTEGDTLAAVEARPIAPPSTLRSTVSAELDRIVLRALARDVEQRYASARELARDLEKFLAAEHDLVPAMDVADWMTRTFPHGPDRIQRLEALAAQVSAASEEVTLERAVSVPAPHAAARATQESWSMLVPDSLPLLPASVRSLPIDDVDSDTQSKAFDLVRLRTKPPRWGWRWRALASALLGLLALPRSAAAIREMTRRARSASFSRL